MVIILANYLLLKRQEYIDNILSLAEEQESTVKTIKMESLLNEYYFFCSTYQLPWQFKGCYDILNKSYIIESEPTIITDMDVERVRLAVDNYNHAKDSDSVISIDDVNVILEYVVQNARKIMSNNLDINTSSLLGECGHAQNYVVIPLSNIGVQVSVNNSKYFPYCDSVHAFAVATFDVIEDGKNVKKRFLIDPTYRQFFSTLLACYGRYFLKSHNPKQVIAPMAGYHIIREKNGFNIAQKILKDGYIELTDEVLLAYGHSFSLQSVPVDDNSMRQEVLNTPLSAYEKSLRQEDSLYYELLDLMEITEETSFPGTPKR